MAGFNGNVDAGNIKRNEIVNNLTSTNTDKPLSAAQGKALADKLSTIIYNKITSIGTYFTERDAFKARCIGNTIVILSYVNITTQVPTSTEFADTGFVNAEGTFLFYSSPSQSCVVLCSNGKFRPDGALQTGYYYVIGTANMPA